MLLNGNWWKKLYIGGTTAAKHTKIDVITALAHYYLLKEAKQDHVPHFKYYYLPNGALNTRNS